MKTIIAGSRQGFTEARVRLHLDRFTHHRITEVVCGGARGVDTFGERWALGRNLHVKYFFPDWSAYGFAAGFRRNREMADYADALIAFHANDSSGTGNMIREALKRGLAVTVVDEWGNVAFTEARR